MDESLDQRIRRHATDETIKRVVNSTLTVVGAGMVALLLLVWAKAGAVNTLVVAWNVIVTVALVLLVFTWKHRPSLWRDSQTSQPPEVATSQAAHTASPMQTKESHPQSLLAGAPPVALVLGKATSSTTQPGSGSSLNTEIRIRWAPADTGLRIEIVNALDEPVRNPHLVIKDIRKRSERSGSYVEMSEFHQEDGAFQRFEIGSVQRLFYGEPVTFNFLNASGDRSFVLIEGVLVANRQSFRRKLTRPGAFQVWVRVDAGEKWQEHVLNFVWQLDQLPQPATSSGRAVES